MLIWDSIVRMVEKITENQKLRLAEQLNTSTEIIEVLFPDRFSAGKMIRILRDKFYLERLVGESGQKGEIELKRILNFLNAGDYDKATWGKILTLLKVNDGLKT